MRGPYFAPVCPPYLSVTVPGEVHSLRMVVVKMLLECGPVYHCIVFQYACLCLLLKMHIRFSLWDMKPKLAKPEEQFGWGYVWLNCCGIFHIRQI